MRTGSVLFLAGVCVFLHLPHLPPPWAAVPAILALAVAARWPPGRPLAWLLAGMLWTWLCAGAVTLHQFDTSLEGRVLTATGRIDSLPEAHPGRTRFNFRIASLGRRGAPRLAHSMRVRLSWYHPPARLLPGDTWTLPLRLKRPAGFMNPGGFDYEAWLYQRGIAATGYVVTDLGAYRVRRGAPWRLDRLRDRARTAMGKLLGHGAFAPLVIALAIGDRSGVRSAQWSILRRSGTSHLLAISGLHIGLLAAWLYALAWRLWPILGRAAAHVSAPRAAAVCALAGAAAYAGMAGLSIPTQRALMMLAAWTACAWAYRRTGISRVLCLSLMAVLVFDPFAVLSAGFWLSFTAVGVIAWAMACRTGEHNRWRRFGYVQAVVAVGLLPVLAAWFQQAPLLGWAANCVAIPWVTLITVPLTLTGTALIPLSPAAAGTVLHLAMGSVALLWPLLERIANAPHNLLLIPAPGALSLILAGGGAAILLLPRGLPGRWLGAAWMLPLFLARPAAPPQGTFQLTLLDVGQGLSAVVRTHAHTLLYDTGPRFSADFDAGRAVILPYLQSLGAGELQVLIQSHGDRDHIGGLKSVLAGIRVDRILAGVPRVAGPRAVACRDGMAWRWDGVDFAILHPAARSSMRGNNRSCVLRISAAGRAALLTGDIEAAAESEIVARYGPALRSVLLVAPHHGSMTSSSLPFIRAVHPSVVLFPAGFHNRFGFPKQAIIRRYHQHGATYLETGRVGAIAVRISASSMAIHTYRATHRRFWHSLR